MKKVFPRIDAFLFLALFLLVSTFGLGQKTSTNPETRAAARARILNNSLLRLHGQLQQAADENSIRMVRGRAATVLAQRAAALTQLIKNDPHAALTFAFSPELLADLADKFPGSSALLESHITVTGAVEHWIADYPDKTSRSIWTMSTSGRNLNLYFAGKEPSNLNRDQLLQVTGVVAGSEMAVESSVPVESSALSSSTQSLPVPPKTSRRHSWPTLSVFVFGFVLALPGFSRGSGVARRQMFAALKHIAIYALICAFVSTSTLTYAQNSCSTTGQQNVAVLLVTFPGVQFPSNITYQNVHDMFFSTTGPSLDGYWREASYGQTSASGDVFGPYTLDSSYANCGNLTGLRDAAIAAAANAGVAIQNYNRVFIMVTDFGCGWTGLSINGCTTLNSPNGQFVASAAFLDASWQRSQAEGEENAAHEGGHGMGLAHAQSRTWSNEPLGPLGDAGTITEYGDPFSDMSCSNSGHYAIPHKAEILNWLSSSNYQVVQSSGTWTLQPLEISPAGLDGLKVQRGTGNNAWLWVEYRQPIGIYESQWAPSGALIHYEDSTTAAHSQLLDFTPGDGSLYNGALMPGNTWTDPYSNVSITVQSADPNGMTVSVNYAPNSCTAATPTVSASPLNPSIYPGNTASYSVTITDNDSSGCSSSTYTLNSDQPSGWPTSFSPGSVTLNPGQSGTVTMYKTGPQGTPAGTYAVNANAANSHYSGSGTANVTVMSAPSLAASLSVSGTTFTRPSTVSMTASVTNGGNPVSGAKVTFIVTLPNGSTTTQTATSGSDGTATWNYKLSTRSATGTYSAVAQAALGSGRKGGTQTATSNTVTFTVQ